MSYLANVECINSRCIQPTSALIFLHGAGETGRDAKSHFKKVMGDRGHEYIKVYFPTAKKRYLKSRDQVTTYWFEAERTGPENAEVEGKIEDADEVVDMLEKMVKEIEASGIPRYRIAIGGSSQGGMVSIYAVYVKGLKVGAVVTTASILLLMSPAKLSTNSRIPLLSLYGKEDAFITEQSMTQVWKILREHKIPYTPRTLSTCGHNMNEEYVKFIIEWLELKIPVSEC